MPRTKQFKEIEILDKALHIFWCKGFNGTSMQDLIDGLGISRSSLYDTYGDKRALFLTALDKYYKVGSKAMIQKINHSTNIFLTIKELFECMVTSTMEDTFKKGCFIVNATIEMSSHDKEVSTIISANQKDIESAFCIALKKGQAKGEITNKHSAKALSRFIYNATSGLHVSPKAGADKKAMIDIVEVTLAVLKKLSIPTLYSLERTQEKVNIPPIINMQKSH